MGFVGWDVKSWALVVGLSLSVFGVSSVVAEPLQNLLKEAQGGNPDAQFRVGWDYETGNGTAVD